MTQPTSIPAPSAEVAAHVFAGGRAYIATARRNGHAVPDGLMAFLELMASIAVRGEATPHARPRQATTPLEAAGVAAEPEPMTPKVLTIDQTARALCCSPRTVQRRIAAGTLTSVRDGGMTRVPVRSVDGYLEQLGAAGC